jgi:arsenical pump membrane protein
MLLAWLSSVIITIGVVAAWRFRELRRRSERAASPPSRVKVGPGLLGVVLAVVAMLALSQPALPVLAIGLVLELLEMMVTRRAGLAELMRVVSPIVVGPLFVIAVLVGWLGRSWHAIGNLVAHTNSLLTALVAGAASLLINNLPAVSLFAGQRIAHPYALLLGLNLGPNAFVTGAMSTMLWFRLVRRDGASPSVRRFVLIGIPVTVLTMAAAVALV